MIIVIILVVAVAFLAIGWTLGSKIGPNNVKSSEIRAKQIIEDAEKEAKNIKKEKLLEVKDEWLKKKQEFDNDVNQRKQKLANLERQVEKKEETADKKFEQATQKEKENQKFESELVKKREELEQKHQVLDQKVKEQTEKLEKIASLTAEDAKKMLIDSMLNKAKAEAAQQLKDIRDNYKLEAKKEAQKIVVQAIQRTAVDHSVESTVSVVQIQNDEMKGRIIGREGRNIRAFEAATGVDVIVDDTPEAVILSAFDQFRREIARISLERLISDGRIHPARIEEVVQKVQSELEEEIQREGETL